MAEDPRAVTPVRVEAGEYVTATGAAAVLAVSARRVSQLVHEGKLPGIKVDSALLIPIDAVTARQAAMVEWDRKERERLAKRNSQAQEGVGDGC